MAIFDKAWQQLRGKQMRDAYQQIHANGQEIYRLAMENLAAYGQFGRDAPLTPQFRENMVLMEGLRKINEELHIKHRQFIPTAGFIVPWVENNGINDIAQETNDDERH